MGHLSTMLAFRVVTATAMGVVGLATGMAQPPAGGAQGGPHGGRPDAVYQRRAFEWNKGPGQGQGQGHNKQGFDDRRFNDRRHFQQQAPKVQSGWFQRPYPYHLDFYKMKYGGSYAPYFGNLYGPPQVVTAPPYYGPYYGGWGAENGGWGYGAGGYPPGAFGGAPAEQPVGPGGMPIEWPVMESAPSNQSTPQPNGESLPVPVQ